MPVQRQDIVWSDSSPSNLYINNKLIKDIMRNYTWEAPSARKHGLVYESTAHMHVPLIHIERCLSLLISFCLLSEPLIFFFSSPSFSLSFLLFHTQVDTSSSSSPSLGTHTHTHIYPEMERRSFWVKEGEMSSKKGEHRKHISYRSLPFISH